MKSKSDMQDQSINEDNPAKTKEELLARQMREAESMLDSSTPTKINGPSIYGGPTLSFMGFITSSILGLICPVIILYVLGANYFGFAIFETIILVYSISMLILAIISYIVLKRSTNPSGLIASLFSFSLVSALAMWVGFGGILATIVTYLLLSHNGWI